MENPKKLTVGKVHKKFHNTDLNEVNSRTSYNKYHNEKSASRIEKSAQEINDNISEKENSVQTSYQYRKRQNGQNSTYSKGSSENQHPNIKQSDEQLSISMSDNDNLICANCINSVLIEEKQKKNDLDKNYPNTDGFFQDDKGNYEKDIINERRKQREYNTNEAIQNLAKINAGLSSKEKLIQMNENSRNPLNDGLPDYQYKKFQEDYERRQKMINENINKFYPKIGNERPEITSYYDNYVNNPKYKKDYLNEENNNINGTNNKNRDYPQKDIDRQEYMRALEEQINQKNEMKRREKEEDRKRAQQQYENMQREMKKEEEERLLKEQKQKEELIRANKGLIEQKNRMKMKELNDKLKYKEYYDRQEEEYKKELLNKQLENEKRKNDIYNDNKNEYENKKRIKREEYNERNNYIDNENNDEQPNKNQKKEKMGRCCRCHRVFPRKLLTINRYFYKENRK